MTINNKSERNYRGKCLGWPVTSYGAALKVACKENSSVCLFGVVSSRGQIKGEPCLDWSPLLNSEHS